jgi:hypothetical protein
MIARLLLSLHDDCSCISSSALCQSRLMFMQTLDHVRAGLESEVQEEQVPEVFDGPQAISCIDTHISFQQGKPQCIPPIILGFSFNH